MFTRRTFLSIAAGSVAMPGLSSAQQASNKVALYANVGADLTHYDVDVAGAELIEQATVALPAGVQYAWPHVSRRYLYVATSSSAPGYGTAGTEHHVTAFSIDPGEWRSDAARCTDTAADPPHPHEHGHSLGEHSGSVQQSERAARLPHQQGLHTRRGGEAAGPHRRRHLRPSGARDTRQSVGDSGNPRERRHPHQGGRSGRVQSLRLQERSEEHTS